MAWCATHLCRCCWFAARPSPGRPEEGLAMSAPRCGDEACTHDDRDIVTVIVARELMPRT
jgi:hypothetical protein